MGFNCWLFWLNRSPPQMWFLYWGRLQTLERSRVSRHVRLQAWRKQEWQLWGLLPRTPGLVGGRRGGDLLQRSHGWMLGGGWTRAYPVLQNTTMSTRVLIAFLFTADPLALIWWGFSPIQNTKLQAQHVELPRAAAARLLEVWQV